MKEPIVNTEGDPPYLQGKKMVGPYERLFWDAVKKEKELVEEFNKRHKIKDPYVGIDAAHLHLCRAFTLDTKYLAHIETSPMEAAKLPLSAKQDMVGDLHRGVAYTEESLTERMAFAAEMLIFFGARRASTCIDATPDIGFRAMHVAIKLKKKLAKEKRLNLAIGPTPIFGLREDRWDVFAEAARLPEVDFLAGLPEKDMVADLNRKDGRIGFQRHIRKVMDLACEVGKEVQFHLDQMNIEPERGTELLLEALEGYVEQPKVPNRNPKDPVTWVIHMISPSCYDEQRFRRLVDGLLKHNVGVIVCPTAGLSMRQHAAMKTRTHNCMARVLELCVMRVPVKIGPDNMGDAFVPQTDGNMFDEIKLLGYAIRHAQTSFYAKLAMGIPLNNIDRGIAANVLRQDYEINCNDDPSWKPPIKLKS